MTRQTRVKKTLVREERQRAWTFYSSEISENTFQWKNAPRQAAQGFDQMVCFQMSNAMQTGRTGKTRKSELINNICSLERWPQTVSSAERSCTVTSDFFKKVICPLSAYLATILLFNLKPSDRLNPVLSLAFPSIPPWICWTWPFWSF